MPATLMWTGAMDRLWGTIGNWSGGSGTEIPDSPDDILIFGPGASNRIHGNNISGLTVDQIQFTDPDYRIFGSAVDLRSGVIDTTASGTNTVLLSLGGAGGLSKTGAGTLVLKAANTYTGATNVSDGVLAVANANALGATSGGTTLTSDNATLELRDSITLAAEPIAYTAAGLIVVRDGYGTITGPITLSAPDATVAADRNSTLTLSGAIGGSSSTNFFVGTTSLSGTVEFAGANTFDSVLDVRGGTLVAKNNQALGGSTNPTIVRDGARLTLAAGITTDEPLQFSGSGSSSGGTLASSFGNTVYSGTATLNTDAITIFVELNLDFSGNLDDNDNGYTINKTGWGRLLVSGNITSSGSLRAVYGGVQVTGSYASTVTLAGGDVSGTGTIGRINHVSGASGTVDPGTRTGSIGTLTTRGGYDVSSKTTTHIDIGGTTAGTTHDQLVNTTSGSIILNDSNIKPTLVNGFVPAIGDRFTIIDQRNSGPVIGTFRDLPEGGTFESDLVTYRVSYVGGDGNDVTLTVTNLTSTWDGGGSDDNWTTADNWVGDTAPFAGYNLRFAPGAARLTNTNNFAAGMEFGKITFAGAGYDISGNAVDLAGGISTTYRRGTSTLGLGISKEGGEALICDVNIGGGLVLAGEISGDGLSLTKAGEGTLTLNGNNTFDGDLRVDDGTLNVNADAALGGATLMLADGTTLSVDGDTEIDNSIELLGPIVSIDVGLGHNARISGVIRELVGVSNLNKFGGGTLNLSAANTYTGYTGVSDGTLALSGGLAIRDGSAVYLGPRATLTLNDDETIGSLHGDGNVDLGSFTLTTGGDDATTSFDGAIGGNGTLTKTGTGTFTLSGTNTYTGATNLVGGTLSVSDDSNLGTGVVNLHSGTVLRTGPARIDNDLAILGDVLIDLRYGLTLSGLLSGTGTLTTASFNTLTLTNLGNEASFGGQIVIAEGSLAIADDDALGSGSIVLGDADYATLRFMGSTTVDNAIVLGGLLPSIVVDSGRSVTLTGIISTGEGFGLRKNGEGRLILTANNLYRGPTEVLGGVLRVDGDISSSAPVVVINGARLQGTGTLLDLLVRSRGTVAPGDSPGILSAGNSEFKAGSVLEIELAGTTVGEQYDQLGVTGTVTIDPEAVLWVLFLDAYRPIGGEQFTVIANDDTDAVLGTFKGLPEGEMFSVGDTRFSISYVGGDGNDVVLTALAAPRIAVASDRNPSAFGSLIVFSTAISGTDRTATGEVTLQIDDNDVQTVALVDGSARFDPISDLAIGTHTVIIAFDGDSSYLGGSGMLDGGQEVVRAGTATSLSAMPNPSTFGQSLTFTANVSADLEGDAPTGSVTFQDGSTVLGTAALDASGVALFSTSVLNAGGHSITANYSGDATHSASEALVDTTVQPAATTTTLSFSAVGRSMTFNANVAPDAPGAGTPNGLVTFLDGAEVIGSATLDDGTATLNVSGLSNGRHAIRAVFEGPSNFEGSTSEAVPFVLGVTLGDYDGDGIADLALYQYVPELGSGRFEVQRSSGGTVTELIGVEGDIPVVGDFDGDGRSDIAVFSPNFEGDAALWTILRSSDGVRQEIAFGAAGLVDVPAPADYDGDGVTDLATFRADSDLTPGAAQWFIRPSSDPMAGFAVSFGASGNLDVPVPADFDGDGRADIATFRADSDLSPGAAEWFIRPSADPAAGYSRSFGASDGLDVPVPADFDGDGRADIATFRANSDLNADSAQWFILPSGGDRSATMVDLGATSSVGAPGDFDGNGVADLDAFDRLLGEWRTRPLDEADVTRRTFGPTGRRVVPVLASIVERLETIEADDDSGSTAARRVDEALDSLDRFEAVMT